MTFMNWTTEHIILFCYCLLLMWNYISSLLEYKKTKQQLKELKNSELQSELELIPKWRLFAMKVIGAFIFKWILFIIAFVLIGNVPLLIVAGILIVLRVYIMYHTLTELQNTKLDLYVLLGEAMFTAIFIVYYFGFVL
ncbi:hypothetical protein [Alkalihalobacillus sp. LMS39]|uniref:hypothetical protein n=1 Tax=Alkalihalobacillus sp. LMS39 TaxID=2924032 RepID=UPI001FB3C8B9|nr:hypothetical protein [Alkalihalobacillus sp. LMS39]UOE94721.1 hypothetical protein MM271_03485 [Alkalihalobacillus sp. LMS39]